MNATTRNIYKRILNHLKKAKKLNRDNFKMEWGNGILDEELEEIIDRIENQWLNDEVEQ